MAVALSEILDWDRYDILRLVTADKIEQKHGSIPLEISGKNPELEHFERGWHMVTVQEKDLLRNQYDTFIRQHKKHQRHQA
ncbi:MAG: hypothetical protein CXZ00_05955 [Acidobacteria bacterium]|mgnify:CR=1 FL=1|nr:MAG: hypothetical protein CXZ00_05955 [Acidobacteriota bacterium]